MKLFLSIIGSTILSFSAVAQEDNLVGKWAESKVMYIDTLDSGRNLVAKDYDAYAKGKKKLESQYFELKEFYPKEDKKRIITITKKNDFFWASDQLNFQQKINYNPTTEQYVTTINGKPMIVKRDAVAKILYFIEPTSNIIFYEFKKID